MASDKSKKLQIVMFPWFALGHMTPFLHLSNKLAEKGHKITFLLPNKAKILLEPLNLYPSLITLHPITVPHVDPLPPGTETASDVPFHLHTHLATAVDRARPEVRSILLSLGPDLVFYDSAYGVPELGGFKSVCYNVVSAATLALGAVPARRVPSGRAVTEEDLAEPPLGYPSATVLLPASKMLYLLMPFGEGLTLYGRVTAALEAADLIAVRTCRQVEGKYCDYLSSQYNKPVSVTGPVLPEPEPESKLEARWAEWLARFGPGSVVFCAFGSQFVLEKAQFQELLLGFEMTKMPFLVAVKPPAGCATVEEAFPEGFAERVRDRGVVHGGWVQQPEILGHSSVGCFVNHCGFGTMWEGLLSDKQLVYIPQLGDQVLNTKIMAGELKVGVEVEREKEGWVSKESLCKAIKCVMDEGSEVGDLVRENHAKWRETMVKPDFMSGYIDNFINQLYALVDSN